ncbi:MAG: aminomethyl-transferring glycine dehydrogenase [Deltaproteobacteria bacterium]|nr:aminomethyl-transferring glycine dehydrogenase [Deltaproteobacteria bacterium]
MKALELLPPTDTFAPRHLGPREPELLEMLQLLGAADLDGLMNETVPEAIRLGRPLSLPAPLSESEALAELQGMAKKNRIFRSLLGLGYSDTLTPGVILRNIFENPGWYTQYTPYQAEIAQGRMEALVNFQTMICDLTGMEISNASLLDEATAAAEAMTMAHALASKKPARFWVASDCHPQTIALLQTRAKPLGLEVEVGDVQKFDPKTAPIFGLLVQYPATDGVVRDYTALFAAAKEAGVMCVASADLLALTLLRPPGEMGADVVIGSAQRFGVPLGAGGPHAAFMATKDEHKRHMPGRIIGVSRDVRGKPGYRLSLQTREQHIRRDKATSNICTAQVLLAVMAGMYAVYHGPKGLLRIAQRVHALTATLAAGLTELGFDLGHSPFFDTLRVRTKDADRILAAAAAAQLNLRRYDDGVGVALDETCGPEVVEQLLQVFGGKPGRSASAIAAGVEVAFPAPLARTSEYLTHEVFNRYHAEHEMLRYLHRLEIKDLALNTSMIPLGSCTMKLNATSEMIPVTWPELSRMHPFAPADQQQGYQELYRNLETWLAEITGFAATSLQPNAGSQGEYTGLLVIRAHHEARGQGHRNVCLIPTSAHGTNPASAVMAGFKVVAVACDEQGNVELSDLEAKAKQHAANLAAMMVTYPSTHGVFEAGIKRACQIIHDHGGQVYLDGANMNAQVGLCRPGDIGADVCHLNLHKTFCIPHGGGGPGMGPICVAAHLAPFLPGHPLVHKASDRAIGPVSAAPYGSPSILPISWMYIRMMGGLGLKRATQVAILSANYMCKRLEAHYPVLYRGENGRVAHEFILDLRPFKKSAGIEPDDVVKRLMDFGFHAPTMSFPVAGTLMIEPTESESKAELDRFCDAMIAIREEIRAIENKQMDPENNPLKHAPHTAEVVGATEWGRPYSREQAAYPRPWVRAQKYWPPVGRIDNAWGDRNLMCSCPPMESYES